MILRLGRPRRRPRRARDRLTDCGNLGFAVRSCCLAVAPFRRNLGPIASLPPRRRAGAATTRFRQNWPNQSPHVSEFNRAPLSPSSKGWYASDGGSEEIMKSFWRELPEEIV